MTYTKEHIWHPTKVTIELLSECSDIPTIKKELTQLIGYLKDSKPTTATHYVGLEDWLNPISDWVGERLKVYGFVNGEPEKNENNPEVKFWWEIDCFTTNIIWSPNLKSQVAHHHSSADARNKALIAELEIILNS